MNSKASSLSSSANNTPSNLPDKSSTTAAATTKVANEGTWKLPDGIEDHLESGILKSIAGIAIGGVVGSVLFKSGKGMRGASVALGLGVALGSTIERMVGSDQSKK